MIEHHYTVIYNSTTGRWYWDEDEWHTYKTQQGTIYDTSTGRFFYPDPDNPEMDEIVAADLEGYSKLNEFLKAVDYAAYVKELDNEGRQTTTQ